jgi:hypothetical protein
MLIVMANHLPLLGQGLGNGVHLAGDVGGSSLLSHGAPWCLKIRHDTELNCLLMFGHKLFAFRTVERKQFSSHQTFQKSAVHSLSFLCTERSEKYRVSFSFENPGIQGVLFI